MRVFITLVRRELSAFFYSMSGYVLLSGALLLLGRIAHPFGLVPGNAGHPLRYVGNGTNLLAALNAMVCIGIHILGL